MSWSFDTSLSTDKDYVRFLIGDTNSAQPLVQDETIEAVLENEANKFMAAAEICEYIARKLTSGGVIEDRKVGETRIRYASAKDLLARVAQLRKRGSAHMMPSFGGVYTSETDSYDGDDTLNVPTISRGMTDNPRIGGSNLTKASS